MMQTRLLRISWVDSCCYSGTKLRGSFIQFINVFVIINKLLATNISLLTLSVQSLLFAITKDVHTYNNIMRKNQEKKLVLLIININLISDMVS